MKQNHRYVELLRRMENRPKNRSHNSYPRQTRKKLISKAKIKQEYYKTLKKEDKNLLLPTFYHEIFDSDIIERSPASSLSNDSTKEKGRKDLKDKKEIKKSKINRKSKPNPFYKVFQKRERVQRERCAERESIRQERQFCKKKREAYNALRNKTKKKLMKCNYKGQPVMKSRIDHILSKI